MIFSIAWRNLWRSPYRSLLIIFSVVLGLWAGVMINAIYYGMGISRMDMAIRQEVSHIQIHHPEYGADEEQSHLMSENRLLPVLSSDSRIEAFSFRTCSNAMLANAAGTRGVTVRGVYPEWEAQTRQLKDLMVDGDYLDTAIHNEIFIGKRLADRMNLYLGDKVVLTMVDTANEITAGSFRICGFYQSANTPLDEANAYVVKRDLDHLLGTNGSMHEAAVLLYEDSQLDSVFADLSAALPDLNVETWKTISPETAYVITSLDAFAMVFMVIILLALAFGIVNTMLMAVLERRRELGMLMAVGMSKVRVFFMVLWETILLSVVGMPIGLLAAWFSVKLLAKTGIDMSAMTGDSLAEFGYSPLIYPFWPTNNLVQTIVLVFVAALISSLFPSWKALRLKPVDAIRH